MHQASTKDTRLSIWMWTIKCTTRQESQKILLRNEVHSTHCSAEWCNVHSQCELAFRSYQLYSKDCRGAKKIENYHIKQRASIIILFILHASFYVRIENIKIVFSNNEFIYFFAHFASI